MHGSCWMAGNASTGFIDGEGDDEYEGWRAKDLNFILIRRGEGCDQNPQMRDPMLTELPQSSARRGIGVCSLHIQSQVAMDSSYKHFKLLDTRFM